MSLYDYLRLLATVAIWLGVGILWYCARRIRRLTTEAQRYADHARAHARNARIAATRAADLAEGNSERPAGTPTIPTQAQCPARHPERGVRCSLWPGHAQPHKVRPTAHTVGYEWR